MKRNIKNSKLVLHNDSKNTLEKVIFSLMTSCKYNSFQSEQIYIITKCVGKCNIKIDEYKVLVPIFNSLKEIGLNVKIEN